MSNHMELGRIADGLVARLAPLRFRPPTFCVYNPLVYARRGYDAYLRKFGQGTKRIILLGMNPGPWGMAQTGVPFGDVGMVKGWLGIEARVDLPVPSHSKRPIRGFHCLRGEVSGRRLWGWARDRFRRPAAFFRRFWVANYCPLVFMEESGRNRTPDKLKKVEKSELFGICNAALRETVVLMKPEMVIGIGVFAAERAREALMDMDIAVGRISHPSPANPKANQGWGRLVEDEMSQLGVL